jgi:hypothetical protein
MQSYDCEPQHQRYYPLEMDIKYRFQHFSFQGPQQNTQIEAFWYANIQSGNPETNFSYFFAPPKRCCKTQHFTGCVIKMRLFQVHIY